MTIGTTPKRKEGRSSDRKRMVSPDACPACGKSMRGRQSRLTFPVNGEVVNVPRSRHLQCRTCGEVTLGIDEARQLREAALGIYRRKYHLLSPEEIRALRETLGLTQAALARLLRLGNNTISRWEAGRNVQTAAMDVLLRLIRDLPGSLDYLRHRAA